MVRRKLIRVSLALIATLGVQVAHGAPERATTTLRATWCCATMCHHTPSKAPTGECCRTARGGGDAATLSAPPTAPQPAAVAALTSAGVPADGVVRAASAPAAAPHARGAPIFLLTRTLRL